MEILKKVRVENLFKIYGKQPEDALNRLKAGQSRNQILEDTGNIAAISDVSFSVDAGEIFVVMGLSGSGKSTLIRCLNRLIEPTAGEIFIDDVRLTGADQEGLREIRRTKMSMVFQHFALFPHKTVAANVEFGLKVRGTAPKERNARALEVLEQVGLLPWADKYPGDLSGGMQQRVGLARCLAVDPEVLLMDEAFSALDPLIRRQMQEELLKLQKAMTKTIVFITHDLNEALILGDRIAIMDDGRFVQVGTPYEIVSSPANDYVAAFTSDIDRSQVFTAKDVSNPAHTVACDCRSEEAAKLVELNGWSAIHVINGDGHPLGLVTAIDLKKAGPNEPVVAYMDKDFPRIRDDQVFAEVFPLCGQGLPVAVLAKDGRLLGKIEQSDVFKELSVTRPRNGRI